MTRQFVFSVSIFFVYIGAANAGLTEARTFLSIHGNFERTEKPSSVTVKDQTFPYDPLVITAVSSLESRTPDKRVNEWSEIDLVAARDSKLCPSNLKA